MDLNEYENIHNFLTLGSYPTDFKSSSNPSQREGNFRRKISPYFISKDKKLFKKTTIDGEDISQEVVLRPEVSNILQKFHDNVGHPGIQSTFKAIQKRFYWLGIYKEVAEYVKTCNTCQLTAPLLPAPQKKLQPIAPPNRPWNHIGLDLIQDLPESPEGYKHALVIVCYLSKYVVARPLKRKTTDEVIENLKDIYLEFELPDIIQHDQGREFKSTAFQDLHDKLGIDNRSTRAYHPMANGLVEAHNKILKMKLSRLEMETGKHWSVLLKSAVLAMNSTVKKSHRRTPFKIMWGRESRYEDLLSYLNNCEVSHEEDIINEEEIFNREICDNVLYRDSIPDVFQDDIVILEDKLLLERCNAAKNIHKE